MSEHSKILKHKWILVNSSKSMGGQQWMQVEQEVKTSEYKWNHWIQKNVFLIELVIYCFIEMIDWHWHPIASCPISIEVVGSSPTQANFLYIKYPIRKLWKNLKNLKKKLRKICHIRKNYQAFDMIGNLEED